VSRLRALLRRPGLIVVLIASAWALVLTYPVATDFGETIYGAPGDATGAVSVFWWWGYALRHGKDLFDNSLQGVPLGSGWDAIPFQVLNVIVIPPLSAVLGAIPAYNLLILSSFPLTAWATYMLARRLSLSAPAAAFSGLAMAFMPYHLEKAQGHGNQTHLEFLAGALYFLVRWRQGGSRWNLVAAGSMAGLELWLDYSVAYVLVFGVLAFFLASVLLPGERRWWPRLGDHVLAGVVTGVVGALFVPLTLLAAHRPGTGGSLATKAQDVQRGLADVFQFSARIHDYVVPWYANPLVPASVKQWEFDHMHASNVTESTLFLGYTVIALGALGVVLGRRRLPVALGLALVVMGVVVSYAPSATVLGHPINMPSHYLVRLFPIFRAYARFGSLVMLGAVLLAGVGFTRLQERLGPGRRQALLLVPFLLLAVEFNNLPPSHTTRLLPGPPEYTWLRSQPDGVLLEYPANAGNPGAEEIYLRQYSLYQMVHEHPMFLTVNSVGTTEQQAAALEPYYAPGVVDQLRGYGVKYVFVHRRQYQDDGFQDPQDVPGLRFVATMGDADVFEVEPG